MHLLHTCLALGLSVSLAFAQMDSPSPAATAMPAVSPDVSPAITPAGSPGASPVKKMPVPVSSMTPKTPPNQPEARNANWEKRANDTTAKAKARAGEIELVFDGDSITDFWQDAKRGLPIWKERYAKYGAVDYAISGDTTQNLLWRLANGQAEGLHPKLIVLMIGTNDMRYTSTPEEIAGGVKEIIAQYRKICPDAVILLQAIFPRHPLPTDPYRIKVKATNDLLVKLADAGKVVYIDFGDKFLTTDGVLTPDIMPDFLHPSAAGYQIWADAIQPSIEKYLGSK